MSSGGSFAEVGLGEVIGGYRLERLLGAGSTSQVFLGTHVRLGRQAAIKVLAQTLLDNKDVVSRLLQEARVVNDIRHPNIIDIIDFIETENPPRVALVMEFIEGPSLKALREFPLSREQALGISLQLVVAVQAAHEAGVIHRDIKPDNLLLTKDPRTEPKTKVPRLKIVDFGIAKLAGTSGKTVAGMMLGTPAYMAPEQVAGRPPPSTATDVFAIGEVIYELLTGQRAYPAVAIHETIRAKLRGELPKLELPPIPGDKILLGLITRCLSLKPTDRPLLQELRDTLLNLAPQDSGTHRARRDAASSIRKSIDPPTAQWLESIHEEIAPDPKISATGLVTVALDAIDGPPTPAPRKTSPPAARDEDTSPPDPLAQMARDAASDAPIEFVVPDSPPTEEVSRPQLPPLAATEVVAAPFLPPRPASRDMIPRDDTSPTNRVMPAMTATFEPTTRDRDSQVRLFVTDPGVEDSRETVDGINLGLRRADSSRTDPPLDVREVDQARRIAKLDPKNEKTDEHMPFAEHDVTDLGSGENPAPAPAELFALGAGLMQPAGITRPDKEPASGLTPSTPMSQGSEQSGDIAVPSKIALETRPDSDPGERRPKLVLPRPADLSRSDSPSSSSAASSSSSGLAGSAGLAGSGAHEPEERRRSLVVPARPGDTADPPSSVERSKPKSVVIPARPEPSDVHNAASSLLAGPGPSSVPPIPLATPLPTPPGAAPGSVSFERARKRSGTKPATIFLIAVLWLVASALIWLIFTIGREPIQVTNTVLDASVKPGIAPAQLGRVVVKTEPAGATVLAADSNRILGRTPLEIDPAAGPIPKRVRITLQGYQPKEMDVTQSNMMIVVTLEPAN